MENNGKTLISRWLSRKELREALLCGAAGFLLMLLDFFRGQRSEGLLLLLLSFAAGAALLYLPEQRRKEAAEKRRLELEADYAELIIRLNLSLTAGLSLRSSWEKMVSDYRREELKSGRKRAAYEEMSLTQRDLLGGMSEDRAYGNFGRRCGTADYLRLGSLLETYIQEGNRELLRRLSQEAAMSLSVELQQAKRRGDRTASLLLLPIVVLFGLTLLTVMVPAFYSLRAGVV